MRLAWHQGNWEIGKSHNPDSNTHQESQEHLEASCEFFVERPKRPWVSLKKTREAGVGEITACLDSAVCVVGEKSVTSISKNVTSISKRGHTQQTGTSHDQLIEPAPTNNFELSPTVKLEPAPTNADQQPERAPAFNFEPAKFSSIIINILWALLLLLL